MEIQTIQNLLRQVSTVSKKYEELAKITGENFNIFKLLGLQANETRLHSAFLAELLNPRGSHGLGDSFLKIFTNSVNIEDFDFKNANVFIEKYIGSINENGAEGGRIDIVIDDTKGHGILIENKIYAGDQENQLLRYYNYGKTHYPNGFNLVYLTLYGNEPSTCSTQGQLSNGCHFVTISYKEHIKNWLENCRKESATHSMLRETITQYIILIKYLTGQAINKNMENEIAELMAYSKESIKAAYTIRGTFDTMERLLLEKLKQELKVIADSLALNFKADENFGKVNEDTYLHFWLNNQDIEITFGFEKWRGDFSIGICGDHINNELKNKIVNSKIEVKIGKSACKNGKYSNWYYLHYFEDKILKDWGHFNAEIWMQIFDGSLAQKLKGFLEICLNELKTIN